MTDRGAPGWGQFVILTLLNVGLWFWLLAWYEIATMGWAAWPVVALIILLWPYRVDLPRGRVVYTVPRIGRWLDRGAEDA